MEYRIIQHTAEH